MYSEEMLLFLKFIWVETFTYGFEAIYKLCFLYMSIHSSHVVSV